MSEPSMKTATLADIRRMKEKGEVARPTDVSERTSLGAEFWDGAEIKSPRRQSNGESTSSGS